jgi:predicted transcriptional regulator
LSIKYWEFEDAPLKEKLKSVNVRDIARIFFDNETEAYRFASLLLEVKRNKQLKLRQVPKNIPISTAKRYLDFAVEVGMLKHEDNNYILTDRFTKPFRNMAAYIKAWMDAPSEEDLAVEFANARTERQNKRGGKASAAQTVEKKDEPAEDSTHSKQLLA